MVGLFDYDTATKEECLEDLEVVLNNITDYDDYGTLERYALRLKYIAQRLQELEQSNQD